MKNIIITLILAIASPAIAQVKEESNFDILGVDFCPSPVLAKTSTGVGSDPNTWQATSATIVNRVNSADALEKLWRDYRKKLKTQYLGSQGFNGEGTIKNWYGNWRGNDFQKCNQTGWSSIINNYEAYLRSTTSSYAYYPWYYYYGMIISGMELLEDAESSDFTSAKDLLNLKIKILATRAYSYLMLMQLYCPRWSDYQGECEGLPIVNAPCSLKESLALPVSTQKDIYQEIVRLTDEVLLMMKDSKYQQAPFGYPDGCFEIGETAVYAIKARAALVCEDWERASFFASKAIGKSTLMNRNEYRAGFNEPNNEWIWGVYDAEDENIFYYGYFAYIGSNSSASSCRSYPAAISKELIDQIPATDSRRELFLVPESDAEFRQMNGANGRVTLSSCSMYRRAMDTGWLYSTSYVFGYMQFKFRAAFMPGGGCFNLFRTSEMYYTKAEADWHLGNYASAQQLIYDVTSRFDDNYSKSTKTGTELLDEIKLYRRFDLWGEGFDWFDYKRWNQNIERKALNTTQGLNSPGSFHSTFAVTIDASESNRWTWIKPERIPDYYEGRSFTTSINQFDFTLSNIDNTASLTGCTSANLVEVSLPNIISYNGKNYNLRSINNQAFTNHKTLTMVTIPDSVTYVSGYAFTGCENLKSFSVMPNNKTYKSVDGVLYSKNDDVVKYPQGMKNTFVRCKSDTTYWIQNAAFSENKSLRYVYADSCIQVATSAFQDCKNLSVVDFGGLNPWYSSDSFDGCEKLRYIYLPTDELVYFGLQAYVGCKSLRSVIVNLDERVEPFAFTGCDKLTKIFAPIDYPYGAPTERTTVINGVEVTSMDPFYGINRKNVTLYVPKGKKSEFESDTYWGKFGKYQEINFASADDLSNQIVVNNTDINCSADNTLSVGLKNAVAISDLEFDIVLPDGAFLKHIEAKNGLSISCTEEDAILHVSVPGASMAPSELTQLCDITVYFPFVEGVDSLPIYAKDILFTSNGDVTKIHDERIWIHLHGNTVDVSDYVFVDGTDYNYISDYDVNNLTYKRTFDIDKWQALYVPFAMKYSDWSDKFEVAYINSIDQIDDNYDGEIDRIVMNVIRIKTGSLMPNTPYLIRSKNIGEQSIHLENVKLHSASVNSINCSTTLAEFTFTGTNTTVSSGVLSSQGLYTMVNGALVLSDGNNNLCANRWYMSVKGKSPLFNAAASSAKRIFLNVDGVDYPDYILGDANNSGDVNVADITTVVSHIYGQTPANFNVAAADVNSNGEINVADITGIVSIIYGGSVNSTKGTLMAKVDEVTLALPTVTANAGASVRVPIYIDRADVASAFQFDLLLPHDILVSEVECNPDDRQCVGAYMADGKFRVVSYSLRNETFVNPSAPVGYITLSVDAAVTPGVYNLRLSSVVSSSANNEFVTHVESGKLIVNTPTGISNIDNNTVGTREITTLGGVKMNPDTKLPKGVYVVNGKKQVVR